MSGCKLNRGIKTMGMQKNWTQFIEVTNAKRKSHLKAARYWNTVSMWLNLSLIFLGAITTFFSLVKVIPSYVVAAIAALGTLLASVQAFLKGADRRQLQLQASQEFGTLMMKMVRCETEEEYEELWGDYTKALQGEPFVPQKFEVDDDFEFTMTPELQILVRKKDGEVKEQSANGVDSQEVATDLNRQTSRDSLYGGEKMKLLQKNGKNYQSTG